jgi:predicted nucleic acid-binding protein
MHLPDINVWLALAFEVHFHHRTAKAWFEETGPDSNAFCRLTQQRNQINYPVLIYYEIFLMEELGVKS